MKLYWQIDSPFFDGEHFIHGFRKCKPANEGCRLPFLIHIILIPHFLLMHPQLIKLKKFNSVLKSAEFLLSDQERHMEALRLLARIYAAKGEPHKGLIYTERIMRMASDSWVTLYLHGTQLMLSRQYAEAAIPLEKARKLAPTDTSVLFSLAKAYSFAGNPARAMSAAVDLLNINPDKIHQRLAVKITAALQSSRSVVAGSAVAVGLTDVWPVGVCFPENDYTAAGWAWDKNSLGKPLDIQILKGNSCISTFKANQFRKDLFQEGIGTGKHGFRVRLPAQLSFDEVSFKITSSSNKAYCFFPSSVRPDIPVYSGVLHACTPNLIKGWAWNSRMPSQRLHVVLEDNLGNSVEVLSNDFDSALLDGGIGDGSYCFQHEWSFPEDARLCAVIRARVHGCSEYLSGSPCTVIDPDRYLDACHMYAVWLRHVEENPLFPPALPELLQEDFLFFSRQQGIKPFCESPYQRSPKSI